MSAAKTQVLLITPPLVQTNTPYPAAPTLAGFLRRNDVAAEQFDMSIAVAERIFSRDGVRRIPSLTDEYERLVDDARDFLRGAKPELASLMSRRGFFPEGPSFRELDPAGDGSADENLDALFGTAGIHDRAKHLASLFLDDIAHHARTALDPHFGFSKYAERLAVRVPDFTPIYERLRSPETTYIDELIEEFTVRECARLKPTLVGITAPFPGTVYGAFKTAECIRRRFPKIKTALGGGYVNTELREMNDPRVNEFFDFVCFDDGFMPLLDICEKIGIKTPPRTAAKCFTVEKPDYASVDFTRYFSTLESANPMHRLWSDGRWLKLQLTRGCYWRKCAFCDTALPYIRDFAAPDSSQQTVSQVADMIRELKTQTGIAAFHFTDEALPPALVSNLCDEIIRRRDTIAWWGNIRFDASFTPALAAKMRAAGCVAVTGGLECANDRLLALMNKGVTLADASRVCVALAENEILVHAYLMYGFPTQTKNEALAALDFVGRLYRDGLIQSSYWHRFALTAHSAIAREPEKFGIALDPAPPSFSPRFALNEIAYTEPSAPDWKTIGAVLRTANYNFMRGVGLDIPAREWMKYLKQ